MCVCVSVCVLCVSVCVCCVSLRVSVCLCVCRVCRHTHPHSRAAPSQTHPPSVLGDPVPVALRRSILPSLPPSPQRPQHPCSQGNPALNRILTGPLRPRPARKALTRGPAPPLRAFGISPSLRPDFSSDTQDGPHALRGAGSPGVSTSRRTAWTGPQRSTQPFTRGPPADAAEDGAPCGRDRAPPESPLCAPCGRGWD